MTCKICQLPGIDRVLLGCGHVYHSKCLEHLELEIDGALPSYRCVKCNDWRGPEGPVFLHYDSGE